MISRPSIPATALVESPSAYLSSNDGIALLEQFASENPHTRFALDRGTNNSQSLLNECGSTIIDALLDGDNPEDRLAQKINGDTLGSTWHYVAREQAERMVSSLDSISQRETWLEAIRDGWRDLAEDADESVPSDMFWSHDRCEVLFQFTNEPYFEDGCLQSHKSWSEPAELAITPQLQHALLNLGYTVGEFRRHFGNHHETWRPLKALPRRRSPIVCWDKIAEVIENACTSYFVIGLYGYVPIHHLLKLDLAKSFAFSAPRLVSYNPASGTFHDTAIGHPVTVDARDGQFTNWTHGYYSPIDICGLHTPPYHCDLANETAQ